MGEMLQFRGTVTGSSRGMTGMQKKNGSRQEVGLATPVQSAVAASLARESGVIIPVQTSLVFFQVSMADLCLVPQVANAER